MNKQLTCRSLLLPIFLSFSYFLPAQGPKYYGGDPAKKLDWTLYYLDAYYSDSVDKERLAELAIIKVLKELDPYSGYQSKIQLEKQRKRDKGQKNDGLGFRYYIINDTATINHIDKGSPGELAGIRKGDKILSVDGTNTVGKNFDLIDKKLLARSGRVVSLSLHRKKPSRSVNIDIISRELSEPSIDAAYMISSGTGFIKLNRFTQKTRREFFEAINDLKSRGMQQLILDLRNNRGGVVRGAIALADEFLPPGQLIMYSEGKGMGKETFISTSGGSFEKGKLVLLVNGATASSSEIISAALQEWDRALLIGEMTYGKGLIQQSYLLSDSSAVRLTIGRYFTPTGRMLQRPYKFEQSKDWLFQNLKASVNQNGFTAHMEIPDSLQWETKGGRRVLQGKGGLVPDIFMSGKTRKNPQVSALKNKGLLYRFTAFHADKFRREYREKFSDGYAFTEDEKIDKKIADDLVSFLGGRLEPSETPDWLKTQTISKAVITQIKAWVGPQIWETGTYYAVINEEDEQVRRAIECLSDNTFNQLGLKY